MSTRTAPTATMNTHSEHTDPADTMTEQERQRLNQRMSDWFNGVTRCTDEDCDCRGEWNRWEV